MTTQTEQALPQERHTAKFESMRVADYNDGWNAALAAIKEALAAPQGEIASDEVPCKTHPDAPHGFNRNASLTEDRYVCDCEYWTPPQGEQPIAYLAWRDGKPSWDEDCVCEDPVYPVDTDDDRTSMPVYLHPAPAPQPYNRDSVVVNLMRFANINKHLARDITEKAFGSVTAPAPLSDALAYKLETAPQGAPSWADMQREAQEIVEGKLLWKRFIDGTPLSNDIACWMADFAQEYTHPAPAPLSDEQINEIGVQCAVIGDAFWSESHIEFARAIERHVRGV